MEAVDRSFAELVEGLSAESDYRISRQAYDHFCALSGDLNSCFGHLGSPEIGLCDRYLINSYGQLWYRIIPGRVSDGSYGLLEAIRKIGADFDE